MATENRRVTPFPTPTKTKNLEIIDSFDAFNARPAPLPTRE